MTGITKYLLDESRIPKAWYNIVADLPAPPAPLYRARRLEAARQATAQAFSDGRITKNTAIFEADNIRKLMKFAIQAQAQPMQTGTRK